MSAQKQAGQAEAHPAAAPAAEHPSPSRSEVLEEAAKKLEAIADDWPAKYVRDYAAAYRTSAQAIRALKDVRPDAAMEKQGEQERDFVLEVAAKIADEFADMFRTEPPFCDNFWAGANIAKAIRDLKDARPDDTALSPLPAKKGGTDV